MAAMDFPPNPTQGQVYSNGNVSYTYNGYAWVGGSPGSSLYAPLLSPVFTGDPRAPTPTVGDNDTSIATTEFVTANAVKKGGDTMTGNLTVGGTVTAYANFVSSTTNVVLANDGSAGGVFLRPNGVATATGQVSVDSGGMMTVNGRLSINAPSYVSSIYFNNSTTGWSAKMRIGVNGGFEFVNHADTAVNMTLLDSGALSASNFSPSYNTDGGFGTKASDTNTVQGGYFNLYWSSPNYLAYYGKSYVGTIAFVSDYRAKKDVQDLTSTWDTVKGLRPISYTQAEFTPPSGEAQARETGEPLVKADDAEQWGFIAHELQETLIPSAAHGEKDMPNGLQSPNPWTILAATTRALQEAMTRIEDLDARVDALETALVRAQRR
jgi:hypothetical protein